MEDRDFCPCRIQISHRPESRDASGRRGQNRILSQYPERKSDDQFGVTAHAGGKPRRKEVLFGSPLFIYLRMSQILESFWFTDLHALWFTTAEVALDHPLLFGRIEDATVGTGQGAEKTSHASLIIDRDNSCFRIFFDGSGGTDMETVRLTALKTDHRTVIGLTEILNRPDSRTAHILCAGLDEGTGLLTIKAIVTFLRIDG
jgi:hypothetical protein